MAIQNTDKLIVGRGNDSYQVSLQDSGISTEEYVDQEIDKITTLQIQITNDPTAATTNIFYNPDTKMLVMKVD